MLTAENASWIIPLATIVLVLGITSCKLISARQRAQKATVGLTLNQTAQLGQTLQGKLTISAHKKVTINRIRLRLQTTAREAAGNDETTGSPDYRYVMVFKHDQVVSSDFILQPGLQSSIPFTLAMPSQQLDAPGEEKLKRVWRRDEVLAWQLNAMIDCTAWDLAATATLVVPFINYTVD